MLKISECLQHNTNRMYTFQTIRGGNKDVKETLIHSAPGRKGGKKAAELEDADKRQVIISQSQSHSCLNRVSPKD